MQEKCFEGEGVGGGVSSENEALGTCFLQDFGRGGCTIVSTGRVGALSEACCDAKDGEEEGDPEWGGG